MWQSQETKREHRTTSPFLLVPTVNVSRVTDAYSLPATDGLMVSPTLLGVNSLARIPVLFLALFLASVPAPAFQQFEEYRIRGHEIRSVKLGPQEVEDPATLVIDLSSGASGPRQLVLETDFDIEPCKATVEEIIGNKEAYVQIVVHITANTMNGVVITQCSAIYDLIAE